MTTRVPGHGRYAQTEREQRWVLRTRPDGLTDPVAIDDVYLLDTHLRLRKTGSAGGASWKLGQKVRMRPTTPEVVSITNIYLDEREYDVLCQLAGARLVKTRWHWMWHQRRLSVDVFGGDLDGLLLAEVELEPDEPFLGMPDEAAFEVTDDDRYSGGALASLAPEAARALIAMTR